MLIPAAGNETPVTAPTPAFPINLDEAKVPDYALPDPLTMTNGETVAWPLQRCRRAASRC